MTGAELIAQERQRQVEQEGWTPEHDARHVNGELAEAAAAYATGTLSLWPWGLSWWKPKDRISNLVRAGALIAAEIDRIQAMEQASDNTQQHELTDNQCQFLEAKANGMHAYLVVMKGIGTCAGGESTASVYAFTTEEAKEKAMADSDPTEEEAAEVFLQTIKGANHTGPGCPCVVCTTNL